MIGFRKPSRNGRLLLLLCAFSTAGTGCGPVSSSTNVHAHGLTCLLTAATLPGAAESETAGDDSALAGSAGDDVTSAGSATDDLAPDSAAALDGSATDDSAPDGSAEGAAASPNPGSQSDERMGFPDYLESDTGLFAYYNQGDSRWAEDLFGPSDPIRTHGCGPTALAMLVSSYTSTPLTPPQAAIWASQNGCCIPGEGSTHAIIEKGAGAFGLSATSLPQHTSEAILDALTKGRVVVALMGPGYFSNTGHFIIIIQSMEDGTVRIADPGNASNCNKNWDIPFLMSQLKKSASNGGPLWTVGYQEP